MITIITNPHCDPCAALHQINKQMKNMGLFFNGNNLLEK